METQLNPILASFQTTFWPRRSIQPTWANCKRNEKWSGGNESSVGSSFAAELRPIAAYYSLTARSAPVSGTSEHERGANANKTIR